MQQLQAEKHAAERTALDHTTKAEYCARQNAETAAGFAAEKAKLDATIVSLQTDVMSAKSGERNAKETSKTAYMLALAS